MRYFILLIFLILPRVIFSNPILIFEKEDSILPVGEYVHYLEDIENNIKVEDLDNDLIKRKFIKNEKVFFNHLASNYPIWLKFDLINNSKSDIILDTGSTFLWYIDCYLKEENSEIIKIANVGSLRPDKNKFFETNTYWIPIPKNSEIKKYTIYLKISTAYPIEVPLRIGTFKSFLPYKKIQDMIMGAFLGIVIIMLLYNFFLFLFIRDWIYFYYIGYLFWAGIMVPFMNHYPFIKFLEFGSIDNNWWYEKFLFWHSFGYFLIAKFLFKYLNLKKYYYKLYMLLNLYVIIFIFGFGLFNLLGVSISYLSTAFQAFSISYYTVCFLTAYYVYFKGKSRALYYALGWTFLMLGMLLFVLTINGILPDNHFTRSGMMIGVSLEVWMFSLALGERFNSLRREKEKANSLILKQSVENEKIIKNQKDELEIEVDKRTSELNQTFISLKKEFDRSEDLLKSIRKNLNFAKKIQSRVLPLELENIEKLNIFSYYEPMEEVGGDLFDIYKIENKVRIILADAEGHGVQAALVTMLIKSALDSLKEKNISPSEVLRNLNEIFISKYGNLNTIFSCIVVDINIENNTLNYSSAGHPEQYLIGNNTTVELSRTGRILGVLMEAEYKEIKMKFVKGDKLLMFTDGLFEEFNQKGEEFGSKSILKLFNSNKNGNIKEIIGKTISSLDNFLEHNQRQDDITFIGIEY